MHTIEFARIHSRLVEPMTAILMPPPEVDRSADPRQIIGICLRCVDLTDTEIFGRRVDLQTCGADRYERIDVGHRYLQRFCDDVGAIRVPHGHEPLDRIALPLHGDAIEERCQCLCALIRMTLKNLFVVPRGVISDP